MATMALVFMLYTLKHVSVENVEFNILNEDRNDYRDYKSLTLFESISPSQKYCIMSQKIILTPRVSTLTMESQTFYDVISVPKLQVSRAG